MSSPAKQARLAAAANGFTEVISRGNNFIVTKNPSGGKCSIDAGVGGGWHYGDGQETDTAWEPGTAPWNYQMVKANYNLFALTNFKSGQIIKWVDPPSGESVAFQPMSLKWTNAINQIQQIAWPYAVDAEVSDDIISWPNAYGQGRHYKYIAGPTRMQKLLTIDEALPSTNYDILELEFIMAPSAGVDIIVDGSVWDRKTRFDTTNEVLFRTPDSTVLWSFSVPTIFDSAGSETTGTLRLRKSGSSLYCSVRFPKAWVDAAVYPIYVDPTIDAQVGASYDDGYWGNGGFNRTGSYLTLGARYGYPYNLYARFPGVTIPDGATIDVAYASVYVHSQTGNVSPCTTRFEDAANPSQISSASDADGRALTTANVSWSLPTSGWSDSPSLVSIIEELMGSYSYASGAAMQLLVFGNNTSGNNYYKNIRSTDGWSDAPILHIEYSESSPYVALAGAIITSSGLAAGSSVLRALSGAVVIKSGLLGAASVARSLAGQIITKSGLLGVLGKRIEVAGQVVTSSTLQGALTLSQIIALAGQIVTQTTLAGAASVSRALAGQVATVSTLTGVPSIARALAGQIGTITAASGVPSCIRGLAGTISTTSALQAATSATKALSGTVSTVSGLSAVPSVLRGLAGQVITPTGLVGVPSVARALTGQIITTSGLSGSASALKALAGVIITSSGLTGTLTVIGQGIVALSGAIVTVSSLAGSMAVEKALQGQVITQSALSGTASAIRGIAGQVVTSSALSGIPSTVRGLAGQIITASSLSGSGRVAIALAGAVSTVTGLRGALTITYENVIALAGQVITASGLAGGLSTIRGLRGQVVTSSALAGVPSLALALAGQVVTSAAADCSASVSIALAGVVSTATTITGHLIDVFQRVKKAARIDSLMTVYARLDSAVKRFGRF